MTIEENFNNQNIPYSSPADSTPETQEQKHERIALTIFLTGFLCQCIWLGSLYYRNSQNKKIARFRFLSQLCFWSIVLLEFTIFWIGLVLVMCFATPIYTWAYNPTFPIGEWFAIFFAIAFVCIVLFDLILVFVKKFQEKALRKALELGKNRKKKDTQGDAETELKSQTESEPSTENAAARV